MSASNVTPGPGQADLNPSCRLTNKHVKWTSTYIMLSITFTCIYFLIAPFAPQRAGNGPLANPQQELLVQQIGKNIRCAVCQGLSVADSPSPMAQAMLDRVRDLVKEGKNQAEIQDYFVARYGEWILLEPPPKGMHWLIWILPVALISSGVAWIFYQTNRKHPS